MRFRLASLLMAGLTSAALAQPAATPTSATKTVERVPVPAANAKSIAVTVNGEQILEGAVQRFLRRVPPDRQTEARPSVIDHLVDNTLVDQYLMQNGMKIDPKEIDKKVEEMKAELKQQKLEYEKVLAEMEVTEAELRHHLGAELRWEKYIESAGNEKALRDLFTAQKEMFDGSQVRVRHILLTPDSRDPKKVAEAKAALAGYRQQINQKVTAELAKLPATADNLAKEKARVKAVEDAFSAIAKEKSACPSKQQGGDVGWFDRAGSMVEAFAKAAFALKRFEMTDVVETQFGFHLILLLDRRDGKDVKFEDVKAGVKEVYAEKLRNMVVQHMRKSAKVVVNGPAKN
jgi:peptidyl-prolyl cis-trans isomerase C